MRTNRLHLVSGVLVAAGMLCLCGTAKGDDCYNFGGTVINGTSGNDILTGTTGRDEMHGLGGDDTFYGLSGDDCEEGNIWSCTGVSTMNGGNGNDSFTIGAGYAYGSDGADYYTRGSSCAPDFFEGEGKADAAFGYTFIDTYGVTFYGQGNDDTLLGSDADDYLDGGLGYDEIWGNDGTDTCVNGESVQTCP